MDTVGTQGDSSLSDRLRAQPRTKFSARVFQLPPQATAIRIVPDTPHVVDPCIAHQIRGVRSFRLFADHSRRSECTRPKPYVPLDREQSLCYESSAYARETVVCARLLQK